MNIHPNRVRQISDGPAGKGPVLYWMNREIRVADNWSLLYAQHLAISKDRPLIVVYNLVSQFLGGHVRQLSFKLAGLEEVEKALKVLDIPFFLLVDQDGENSAQQLIEFCQDLNPAMVVTDQFPLRISKQWVITVSKAISCPLYEVDSHNIVPVWVASNRKEFAAHTIRKKIWKKLPTFFEKFPALQKQSVPYTGVVPVIDWQKILPKSKREKLDWIQPGCQAAHKVLQSFLQKGLHIYANRRNDPNQAALSNLSPYFHYGMIAPQRVALELMKGFNTDIDVLMQEAHAKSKLDKPGKLSLADHAGTFLEEMIIRRELADNFCFYEEQYDHPNGFHDWAKGTIAEHAGDTREYIYSTEVFEAAQTHDDLWNAAQLQMVKTGKMHGYLRMYWAKKILEWTPDVGAAMDTAIYLNDKYELDGRDPNGYVGIAWSIGGVHDRAWFERPVFGKIRYMARSGCERKFDTKRYINKWLPSNKLSLF